MKNSNSTTAAATQNVNMEEADFYINKFFMKMNGSSRQTSKEWVEGACLDSATEAYVWKVIARRATFC